MAFTPNAVFFFIFTCDIVGSMSKDTIVLRKDVPASDKWDLTTIYKTDDDWEAALKTLPELSQKIVAFKGRIGESKETLLESLKAEEAFDRTIEDVFHYASLQTSADQGDSVAQDRYNRVTMAYTKCSAEQSFILPEYMAIEDAKINEWIKDPAFDDYRVCIQKRLHAKPHTLSEKEERLIALSSEASETADNAFSMLNDVDMEYGTVTVDGVEKPLTHGTWIEFLENKDRNIRKEAYTKFYGQYNKHANTLAALYAGSVNNDIFYARAKNYKSCLDAALYNLEVPESVYRNLVDTVHKNFDALHKYYSIRRRVLGVEKLAHYDVYVPLVSSVETKIKYEEAVEICRKALAPLGKEYTDTLCGGLLNGWCDRYENKGKRSGAFSSGCYNGYPYILLNYNENSIGSLYTMAHEGGHSMHSWNSVRNNPFMSYDYTLFEAEVASTFNEDLIFKYLLKDAEEKGDIEMQKFLIADKVDSIIGTLYRQTMFAEFELKAHESVENGTPLTLETIRKIYKDLLVQYFGPEVEFEETSDLECLRIPHFYRAFYVYQYATGISASLALSKRVTEGGEKELNDYFNFLKSGGSRYPIDALRVGGVDMASTEPVQAALDTFRTLVEKLEKVMF